MKGQIVRGGERIGVPEIDLVLAGSYLVMRRLHLKAHFHQLLHDHSPDFLTTIDRSQVEVGRRIVSNSGGRPVGCLFEEKEFGLAPRHHRKAEFPGPLDLPLERGPGAAGEG
ncbi:MAG TPA: hypothetical protein VGP44_09725, partial [Gemmatimonadales bacterium]|nr:hypothetical protein [Gemmatimonadales bacterium]